MLHCWNAINTLGDQRILSFNVSVWFVLIFNHCPFDYYMICVTQYIGFKLVMWLITNMFCNFQMVYVLSLRYLGTNALYTTFVAMDLLKFKTTKWHKKLWSTEVYCWMKIKWNSLLKKKIFLCNPLVCKNIYYFNL